MKTACIIGLGLIGGSLAKALKQKAGFTRITAFGRNETSLKLALDENVIDNYWTNLNDIDFDCDIVFICTPVTRAIELLAEISKRTPASCIITDVGSTKATIVEAATALGVRNFVGGHPMAGSEKSGYGASTEFLFENAFYLITPSEYNTDKQVESLKDVVLKIGAIPVIVDAKRHDHIVAAVSHLPHVIAASLVNTVAHSDDAEQNMHTIAAGGFKDITRIASSDSDMWQNICMENDMEILNLISVFKDQLNGFEQYIKSKNGNALWDMFKSAREYRDSFDSRSSNNYFKTYNINVDVVDKPGSIATIATLLSVNSINIKNIGIINNREHQAGALQITFGNEDEMKKSVDILRNMNYSVYIN